MTPVDQTVFGDGKGNCFAACVATILGLDINSVPNFCGLHPEPDGTWYRELVKWLANRGLSPLTQRFPGDPDSFMQWADVCAQKVPWIAGGPTDRGLHCCVYVGTKLFHDPNPNHGRKGLDAVEDATFLLCHSFGFCGVDYTDDSKSWSRSEFYGRVLQCNE